MFLLLAVDTLRQERDTCVRNCALDAVNHVCNVFYNVIGSTVTNRVDGHEKNTGPWTALLLHAPKNSLHAEKCTREHKEANGTDTLPESNWFVPDPEGDKEEGAVESILGNEGRIAQAWSECQRWDCEFFAVYFWHSGGWTPRK